MSIIEQLLRIIAPHHCLGCGREEYILCPMCAKKLPAPAAYCYRCYAPAVGNLCDECRPNAGVTAVLSFACYNGLAKEVVHLLKFERAHAAAVDIAAALAGRFHLAAHADAITYIPTAPARTRTRGYDQAALIARATAKHANLPCYTLLARLSNNRQVGQNRTVRKEQMLRAFYASRPYKAAGLRVLLVDDVLTTGATCEAAAAELCKAGAANVTLLTFAAAPPPGAAPAK